MKKLLLIGILFMGGCKEPQSPQQIQQTVIINNSTFSPKKVAEIEGRDLYMVPVQPYGPTSRYHYIYYFKEGEVKSVNFSSETKAGKYENVITINGTPYKKQAVPNE